MKRTWKKTLTALMALAMVLSLCVIPAAAEEADSNADVDPAVTNNAPVENMREQMQESNAAEAAQIVGGASYSTLAGAVEAAPTGSTIQLLQDITMDTGDIVTIPADKTLILDMNEKSITTTTSFTGRPIINEGTLTVCGNGTIDSSLSESDGLGAINNEGTLTIENGTYRGATYASGSAIRNTGAAAVLTIEDGTFEKATCAVYNEGTAVINGGTYSGTTCSKCNKDVWSYTIKNGSGTPRMTINAGTVTGTQGAVSSIIGYLEVNGGNFKTVDCAEKHGAIFYALYAAGAVGEVECVVNGGRFETLGIRTAALIGNDDTGGDGGINEQATAHINGGTFIAPKGVPAFKSAQKTGDPTIVGGTFSSDPSAYVAPGYTVEEAHGTFTVTSAAKIGTTPFGTLAEAVTAAVNDDTIVLMKDLTESIVIPAGKTLTLDLNGNKLTGASGHTITNNGTLTIKDGISNGGEIQGNIATKSAIQNEPNATVTVESGTISKSNNTNSDDYYVITNHGTMTIKGGVITSASSHSSAIENGWYKPSDNTGKAYANLTITGGSVSAPNASGGLYTLKNDDYGIMTITGGTFENSVSGAGTVLNWNELTINGGTFTATSASVATMVESANGVPVHDYEKGKTTIAGGTFVGALGTNAQYAAGITISITGGTFNTDIKDYVASGYSVRQDGGNYIVYRPSSGSSDSGSSTPPPKTETDKKTEGDVTTETTTKTTTNKDGSKTMETKETATNAATGEKTEVKATETVAKDGSVTKEETKVTTTAGGAKTEEKTTATVDAKTGTSATTTVKTDEAGASTAAIVVENSKNAKEVTISADVVKSAAQADTATMTVKTAGAEITLDASAIAAVAEAKGKTVEITVETVKTEALPAAAKEALKDAVVVDLSITVGDTKVSSFNGGKATVAVPYTKVDSGKAVAVYYVASDGTMTRIPGATYDAATKSVKFSTGHFSYYAVKEETPLAFTDVADADWYYDAVRYVSGAQLFNGTSATTFGPTGAMTREMLATVLYRKAGSPASDGMVLSQFTDGAQVSEWAKSAMGWAVHEGILTGVGEEKLDPQGAVTRQQLAVILYRAAGNPAASATALSAFSDSASVADWAESGMSWAVEKGVVTGRGNALLDPTGIANRAEVAAMLMRIA